MQRHADLELNLWLVDSNRYRMEVRYINPHESDAAASAEAIVTFDEKALFLLLAQGKTAAYGQRLYEQTVLANPQVAGVFTTALRFSQRSDALLHLRLRCGESARALHNLWWELLRDDQGRSLVTTEHVLFSRYLEGSDMVPPRLRALRTPRALGVVANPNNLKDLDFAPIKPELELARLNQALTGLTAEGLPADTPATLGAITSCLHAGEGYDILYLVAHGRLAETGPLIVLADKDGAAKEVRGEDLADQIAELRRRPNVVILASCESAGVGTHRLDPGVLLSLGPLLVRRGGVPVVLAMHGQVSMDTIQEFMPAFLDELIRDGQADRAMAVARGKVRENSDSWMPVLYSRLRSTAVWYSAELTTPAGKGEAATPAGKGEAARRWAGLVTSIRRGECVPILGPDLGEPLAGLRQRLVESLASDGDAPFPLTSPSQADLPRVAQNILLIQGSISEPGSRIVAKLVLLLRRELQKPTAPPPSTDPAEQLSELNTLLGESWQRHASANPADPYTALAQLKVPIYVTTDQSSLLAIALERAGRPPRICLSPWKRECIDAGLNRPYTIEQGRYKEQAPRTYKPTSDNPLIFHAFGHLDFPKSLVLTEDQFFEYLIGITEKNADIHRGVKAALSSQALIYLGFRPDDWYFRTLFRVVRSLQGTYSNDPVNRVAAQIPPDIQEVYDLEGAREYFRRYFGAGAVDLYWGSVEEFVEDLNQQLK